MIVPRRVVALAACASLVLGCSAVPNMDEHGSGCANKNGPGPRTGEDPPGIPLAGIAGLTPVQAAAAAARAGHVVVFRQDGDSCVCVPPTGYGRVEEGWWGSRGQLYVDLANVEPQGDALPDGAGC